MGGGVKLISCGLHLLHLYGSVLDRLTTGPISVLSDALILFCEILACHLLALDWFDLHYQALVSCSKQCQK